MSSSASPLQTRFTPYQKLVVGFIAFLQFTMVLDFMLLSPLGALLMPALHITPAQFGWLVSSYAFSAGIAGVCAAGFADRYDRKKLLLGFYAGFIVGTLLCGLASSYELLLGARMVTGVFAGLVGSVCFAIITDIFPMEMRGRVMGFVQTAFAACSVLGLPISLALSAHWGWNAPFLLIVAVGTVVGLAIARWLKPVDAHLKLAHDSSPLHHLATTVSNPRYILGFVTTSFVSVGGFMLMPFVSAFNVHNVGVPFTSLPMLYLITGFFAAGVGPLIGRASDAFGKYQVFFFGGVVTIVMVIIYTHMSDKPLWYLIIVSILLQIGIFSRIISGTALTSGLPEPADRGAYMSITSSLQQIAGGIAAVVAGQIVVESATGTLLRFDLLGYTLSVTTVISMGLMYLIARRIRRDSGAPRPASEVVVP